MKIQFDNKREKFILEHCLELAIRYMKSSEYYLEIPVNETKILKDIILKSEVKS